MDVSPSATRAATAAAMSMRWSAMGSTRAPFSGQEPRHQAAVLPFLDLRAHVLQELDRGGNTVALLVPDVLRVEMVVTPLACVATTATMGNRSGASARSIWVPRSGAEATVTVPSAPRR